MYSLLRNSVGVPEQTVRTLTLVWLDYFTLTQKLRVHLHLLPVSANVNVWCMYSVTNVLFFLLYSEIIGVLVIKMINNKL